ncbi:hypothetical protein [Fodinibius halophilus]|uniref:Thioredoxin family protein n=1 Tax=Fodinibius halophilus TaxID=1736908 RepID=A0A6M1T643_9BACT|nr:hypothetical protein [Fodinibius halophilus]NGP88103.1 hypothetical protein [Fodinibius halophilus]
MNKYGYFVLAVLLVVDVALIINNREINDKYHQLSQQVNQPITSLNNCRELDCFQEQFLDESINGINVVFFIPAKTCISCSKYALNFLENYNTLSSYTKVVFVQPYFDSEYQKLPNIDYITVNEMSGVFDGYFQLVKPTVLVMDKYNTHLLYELSPGDGFMEEKMHAFWNSAESFYKKVYSEDGGD